MEIEKKYRLSFTLEELKALEGRLERRRNAHRQSYRTTQ